MTLPNESVGPNGIDFTTATCVSAWIEYPFNQNGDSDTKVYRHIMQVKRANYAPLEFNDEMTAADSKPERSPFPDDALAFWVGDTQPTQIGGDLVEFQRTFANVPASRTEGYGLYPFDAPGVDTTATLTTATSIGSESASSVWLDAFFTFEMSGEDAANFPVNSRVDIYNDNQSSGVAGKFRVIIPNNGNPIDYFVTVNDAYVTENDGSLITCKIYGRNLNPSWNTDWYFEPSAPYPYTTFTVTRRINARAPKTVNNTASVDSDYFKADNIFDIDLINKFQVYDASLNPTDTLTSSTNPTKLEYQDFIDNRTLLPAEISALERWMGNIWLRATISTIAQ